MPTDMVESVVDGAFLLRLKALGYGLTYGPDIAPDETGAARRPFGDVALGGRLRQALKATNDDIPTGAPVDAARKLLVTESPSLAENSRRIHQFVAEEALPT